jgi:hypothetical protein
VDSDISILQLKDSNLGMISGFKNGRSVALRLFRRFGAYDDNFMVVESFEAH